jgi:hypothetical protein
MSKRSKLKVIEGGKRNFGVPQRPPVIKRTPPLPPYDWIDYFYGALFAGGIVTILVILYMSAHA